MFALPRISLKCASFVKFAPIRTLQARLVLQGRLFSSFSRAAIRTAPVSHTTAKANWGLVAGVFGLAGAGSFVTNHSPIRNDAVYADAGLPAPPKGYEYVKVKEKSKFNGAFGGKLNYKELTLGSIFGMITGMVVGQFSTAAVFLALGIYVGIQYLHSQGILTIPATKLIKIGTEEIDVRELVFNQPSFSLTYILSFLIGAFNT